MNRIQRFSMIFLEKHRDLFTTDFEKNKLVLKDIASIRSKQLRNEIAGHVTRFMRREMVPEEEEGKEGEESPPQEGTSG